MKNGIVTLISLISAFSASAQTGIGTTNPDPSSILHLMSEDKGLLIPRVQLLNIRDNVTIPVAPNDEGILVFNLLDAGTGADAVEKEKFYIWTGTQWEGIGTLTEAREFIDIYNISSTVFIGTPTPYAAKPMIAANTYTAWEDISFANEIDDLYGIHDPNTGIFTASASGLHSFFANIAVIRSTSAGTNKSFGARILFRKAAATEWTQVSTSYFGTGGGGSSGTMPLFWSGNMVIGDQLKIQFRLIDSNNSGTYGLRNMSTSIYVIENFKRN